MNIYEYYKLQYNLISCILYISYTTCSNISYINFPYFSSEYSYLHNK